MKPTKERNNTTRTTPKPNSGKNKHETIGKNNNKYEMNESNTTKQNSYNKQNNNQTRTK